MSVVDIQEIHNGREGGDDLDQSTGAKSNITRQFRVYTNSPYDGPDTVLQACDNLGVRHPTASWLYVKSRKARNEEFSKLVWIVTLNYSSEWERTTNPLSQPAEIDWNTESEQSFVWKDINDQAILNSAGDYYEDGVPAEIAHWTIKIKKNLPYVPSWIGSYRNAINSDNFYIDGHYIAARTAKIRSLKIEWWANQNGIWYRPIELTIKLADTWVASILDQGLRQTLEGFSEPFRTYCINNDGTKVSKPVLLDGEGAQLFDISPENAVFRDHYIYPELPFSALPIH
jgi:hypothetical protein